MAIKKDIPLDNGAIAGFWKATAITIDYVNMKAYSTSQGYFSEEVMNDTSNKPSMDTDVVSVNLFWTEEDMLKTWPRKSDELIALEKKKNKTEEEIEMFDSLIQKYQDDVSRWINSTNNIVITPELKKIFDTLLKLQYSFHLKWEKLKWGELIP